MPQDDNKKYGFEVGKVYRTSMKVEDENGTCFDAGTLVKIVAIVPKVRIVTGYRNKDAKTYFYNAVLFHNQNSPRIRENFCTLIRKVVGV